MTDDIQRLITIAHHEPFVLRWAKNIDEVIFHWFSEKIRLDVLSESSARQRIHLKNQALFSSKVKSKQEGHDGPGSLTWVSLEPNYFKICPPVKQKKLFKAFFYLQPWRPFCSTEQNSLSNFCRQSLKEHSCIIISKSMHWLRWRSHLKVFYF